MKDRIFESKENYLETILILHNRNGEVRSIDIALEMGFSKPSVSIAMKNLLNEEQNRWYRAYKVNVCAGTKAGIGLAAVDPVRRSMEPALDTQTITLSCGKLTTGVTIKPWTGIFMLRNLKSPETYFQSAFRVQSPWTTKQPDGSEEIIKHVC